MDYSEALFATTMAFAFSDLDFLICKNEWVTSEVLPNPDIV